MESYRYIDITICVDLCQNHCDLSKFNHSFFANSHLHKWKGNGMDVLYVHGNGNKNI